MTSCDTGSCAIAAGSGIVISGSGTSGDPWLLSVTDPVDITDIEDDIANLQAALLALPATYVNVTGDTMTDTLVIYSTSVGLRLRRNGSDQPFLDFLDSTGLVRQAYVQGNDTGLILHSDVGHVRFDATNAEQMRLSTTMLSLYKAASSDIAVEGFEFFPAGGFWSTRTTTNAPNIRTNKVGAVANVDGAIHMEILSAGTQIGRITRATSTTAGFLTTSDEDLKENLVPVDDDLALLWLRTIEPYWFNYKDIPSVRHTGYSAQRVAAAWPNGVANGIVVAGHGDIADRTWDEDGNETTPNEVWEPWMFDHAKITPILHAGLQAIDRVVDARTAVLDDHETRIDALEATVATQAQAIAALTARVVKLEAKHEHMYVSVMWQFSNQMPPAGANQIRVNNVNFSLVTSIDMRRVDADGADRSSWLQGVKEGATVRLSDFVNAASYHAYKATGPAVLTATNAAIPVIWDTGSGTLPNNKAAVAFVIEVPLVATLLPAGMTAAPEQVTGPEETDTTTVTP